MRVHRSIGRATKSIQGGVGRRHNVSSAHAAGNACSNSIPRPRYCQRRVLVAFTNRRGGFRNGRGLVVVSPSQRATRYVSYDNACSHSLSGCIISVEGTGMKRPLILAFWLVGSFGAIVWSFFVLFAMIHTKTVTITLAMLDAAGVIAAWLGFKTFFQELRSN
jgi:hypothetical protein